jgi:hypothetical protein
LFLSALIWCFFQLCVILLQLSVGLLDLHGCGGDGSGFVSWWWWVLFHCGFMGHECCFMGFVSCSFTDLVASQILCVVSWVLFLGGFSTHQILFVVVVDFIICWFRWRMVAPETVVFGCRFLWLLLVGLEVAVLSTWIRW